MHVGHDDAQNRQAFKLAGKNLLPLGFCFVPADAAVHHGPAVLPVDLVPQQPQVDVVQRKRQAHAYPSDAGCHLQRAAGGRQNVAQGVEKLRFLCIHLVRSPIH